MYCVKCGASIDLASSFCASCGASITGDAASVKLSASEGSADQGKREAVTYGQAPHDEGATTGIGGEKTLVSVPNNRPKGRLFLLVAGILIITSAVQDIVVSLFFGFFGGFWVGISLFIADIFGLYYTPVIAQAFSFVCLIAVGVIAIVSSASVGKVQKVLLIFSTAILLILIPYSIYLIAFEALERLGYGSSLLMPLIIEIICAALILVGVVLNKKSPKTMQVPNTHPLAYKHGLGAPRFNTPAHAAAASAGAIPQAALDAPNMGFAVLSFFIPLVGLILFLVWKDQTPLKAKSCGKGALIGGIVYVVVPLVVFGIFSIILFAIFR